LRNVARDTTQGTTRISVSMNREAVCGMLII